MIAFDGGVFNGAVHAFNLSVGPRMFDLGEMVFDFVFLADPIKEVHKGLFIAFPVGELDAVIGQNMRDFVRHGGNQVAQDACRDQFGLSFMQFRIGEFRCLVDGHEEIEFTFFGTNFGNIDREVADRIFFKLFLLRLVAFHVRQTADPVALITAVQRRARQVRERRLQGIEAIV